MDINQQYNNGYDYLWSTLRNRHSFTLQFEIDGVIEDLLFITYTKQLSSKPEFIKGYETPHIGLLVSIPRLAESSTDLHLYRNGGYNFSSSKTTMLLNKLVKHTDFYRIAYKYLVNKILTKINCDCVINYDISFNIIEHHKHPFFEPILIVIKKC